MDGVGVFDPLFVADFATLFGEFLALRAVIFGEGASNGITGGIEMRGNLFKETTAHNRKAFFRVGRSPGRLDTAKDLLETDGGFLTTLTACLGFGGWNGGNYQGLWGCFGCFCEILCKAKVGFKGASGQTTLAIELTRKNNPFIDKY